MNPSLVEDAKWLAARVGDEGWGIWYDWLSLVVRRAERAERDATAARIERNLEECRKLLGEMRKRR